jgi:hypothetical protein
MCRENGQNDRLFCLEERIKLPLLGDVGNGVRDREGPQGTRKIPYSKKIELIAQFLGVCSKSKWMHL